MKSRLFTISITLLLFSGLALWRMDDLARAVLAACGSWVAGASAPTTRSTVDGVEINGLMYVFGNGGGLDVYNPVTNTWATRTAMPAARVRSRMSSAVIDGKLYVVGGQYDLFNYSNFLDVYDPVTNAWTTKANMPTARCDAVAGVINGKLYVASGQDIGYRNNLEVYDPATNTWAAKAPIPVALSHSKGAAIDNKLYVPGGGIFDGVRAVRPQNFLQIYDAVTDTWTQGPVMPTARFNPAVTVRDGRLHVLGGSNDPIQNHALQTHEVYDPVTGTWTSRALMPSFRERFAAATIGGKIYGAYGHDFIWEFERLEIYAEPEPSIWIGKAALSAARSSHTATLVNGRIYVTGGFLNTTQTNTLGIYNPVNNTWRSGANMPTARSGHGAAAINGKLYVVGGSTIGVGARNVLEIYDPVANTWANGATMPAPRTGMAVAALNGKLYVVGGSNASGVRENKLEIYDPVSNTWTSGAGMPTARQFAVAGFIHGKLYVVGGENGGTKSNKVEIYDPAANTWTTGAVLPVARSLSAAAVLHGRLHVLGGDAGFALSARHDVYDPVSNTWTTPADVPVARSAFAAAELNGGIYAIGGHDGANVISRMDAWLAASDLSLSKTHTGQFTVGTPGDYTLTVSNAANAGCASGPVYVLDTLPAGLSYNSVIGAGWTCTPAGLFVTCINENLSLGPGESNSFTLRVNVDSHGQGTNLAELWFSPDDGTSGNNAANDPTVMCPAFTIGTPAATALLGQNYNSTVAATPAAPASYAYRYALVNSTTLPPGLTLDAVSGAITGVATTGGVFTFDVRVSVVNASTLATLCSVTQTSTITACTNSPLVTSLNDSGPGSLREAIASACVGSVITFSPGLTGTLNLASPLPDIARNLTINGPGAHLITVRRNTGGDYRIFNIPGTGLNVTIKGLTISNGKTVNENGGGIKSASNLTLTDCAITGNESTGVTAGGGVYLSGADGLFTGCEFSGNIAGFEGGGLEFDGSNGHSLRMVNCTVSGNTARGDQGSGILNKSFLVGSTLDLVNCTIAGNISPGGGGGSVTTGSWNQRRVNATTRLRNTIISHNVAPALSLYDFRGLSTVTSLGNNLATDGANGWLNQASDKINTNPQLDVLGNYGGPTQTYALLTGSPAINAGNDCVKTNNCADNINLGFNVTTDQRGSGFPRLSGSAVDIGAFEYVPCPTITATMGGGGTICATQSANVTVMVSGGRAPYTVTLTNGGGTQTGNGPTFTFAVSPGATTSYQVAAGSKDANNCPMTNSGTATVTVTQPPTTATVGGPQTICDLGTTAGLGGNTPSVGTGAWSIVSGGTGTFAPNATTPNATFTHTGGAGPVLLRWTITGSAPCSPSTADVTVTINQPPTPPPITATPPSSVCGSSTGNIASGPAGAATYAWTITNGTITSATNIQTITYTAGAAGNVSLMLTVTNAAGCSASKALSVPSNTPPTVGTYASAAIAPGGSATVTPSAAPADNGSIASVTAVAVPNTFTGMLTGDPATGAVTLANAGPAGVYTLTVTVTDNCGATVQRTFIAAVTSDLTQDTDSDGIPDLVEIPEGTHPLVRDNDVFTSNRLFVMQQYRDILGREGEATGITFWTTQLNSVSRAQVLEGFLLSEECQSSSAEVLRLYLGLLQRYSNRPPVDLPGLRFHQHNIRLGGFSLDTIKQGFTEAAEFPLVYTQLNHSDFVAVLYSNVLRRPADGGGLAYWTGLLTAETLTRPQVAMQFLTSAEYLQLAPFKFRDEVFVALAYAEMLRRVATANEYTAGVSALNGGATRESLVNTLLADPAYRARFLP